MKRDSLEELKNEFENKKELFTPEEMDKLAYFGFVMLKDYKEHLTGVEEAQ